jgi:hypothetical protein
MLKIHQALICLFTIVSVWESKGNPIILFRIYELRPDSVNFALEIFNPDMTPWDGWYVSSSTDTSYFKNGLQYNTSFKLITQDSLSSPLSLNKYGDVITLYSLHGPVDMIRYGEGPDAYISAPKPGQSICLNVYYQIFQHYYYYLDSTPTLGAPNDSSGAWGFIQGTVTDSAGNPLKGIEIIYDYTEIPPDTTVNISVFTTSNGYFILKDLARIESIFYNNGSGDDQYWGREQIWPDDTVSIQIISENISHINIDDTRQTRPDFELSQNYPNPFNVATVITYTLSSSAPVELNIFNITGRLVESLVKQEQPAGRYEIVWNAQTYASGIYFYQLKAGESIRTKKMLLIR